MSQDAESPASRRDRKSARLVALAAMIFAFGPLLMVAVSPMSDEATREGADMRPLLMFVTVPVGVVIAMISLSVGKRASRQQR